MIVTQHFRAERVGRGETITSKEMKRIRSLSPGLSTAWVRRCGWRLSGGWHSEHICATSRRMTLVISGTQLSPSWNEGFGPEAPVRGVSQLRMLLGSKVAWEWLGHWKQTWSREIFHTISPPPPLPQLAVFVMNTLTLLRTGLKQYFKNQQNLVQSESLVLTIVAQLTTKVCEWSIWCP